MKICVESHHLFLLRGEVEEGLAALYDGSNPLPLQMLLIKEKEVEEEEKEEDVEKLRTPRLDSGNNKELQPSLLDNSPSRSEVEIFMN